MDYDKPIKIAEDIYWVGYYNTKMDIQANPYLIIDNDEAILIDPGSVLDFEIVKRKVESLIDLKKIKYIILNHQDPDIASSTTLFEKKLNKDLLIICHWRTYVLVRFYGIISKFYNVNENNYEITLKSGRKIEFIESPYLHFPGAIMTYDAKSEILFSSDIFGSFSEKWELYANKNYYETMLSFHEHYMPGNEYLRPIMDKLDFYKIKIIAPQHGSVINKEVRKYIRGLRDLECGSFLDKIKINSNIVTSMKDILTKIIKRYISLVGDDKVIKVLEYLNIKTDKEMTVVDYNHNDIDIWDLFEV